MTHQLRFIMAALLLLLSAGVAAQAADNPPPPTEKQFGDHLVFFNVLSTDFLTPAVAQRYDITRGSQHFLVNVAVRNSAQDRAVKASVSGSSSDLIHRHELTFREIVEQDAIYYIASFEIRDTETRDFRLQIQPQGDSNRYDLNFNRKLYIND